MSFHPRKDRCSRIDVPGRAGCGSLIEFAPLSGLIVTPSEDGCAQPTGTESAQRSNSNNYPGEVQRAIFGMISRDWSARLVSR